MSLATGSERDRTIINLKTRGVICIHDGTEPIPTPGARFQTTSPLTEPERTQIVWKALRFSNQVQIDVYPYTGNVLVSRPYNQNGEARLSVEVLTAQAFISRPLRVEPSQNTQNPIAA